MVTDACYGCGTYGSIFLTNEAYYEKKRKESCKAP